jgi:hypothetical protein
MVDSMAASRIPLSEAAIVKYELPTAVLLRLPSDGGLPRGLSGETESVRRAPGIYDVPRTMPV